MRIVSATVERVTVEPSRPIVNARAQWTSRSAAVLSLRDEAGHVGLGEASPLPGWSPDALEDAVGALSNMDWRALDRSRLVDQAAAAAAQIPGHLPSARFAAECALLDLASRTLERPLHELLAAPFAVPPRELEGRIRVAVLIAGRTDEERIEQARAAVSEGAETIKLKLGGKALEDDLALLERFRRALPHVAVRLDFNGTLRAPLDVLAPFEPELVEEPYPLARMLELEHTPVPLAMDESLLHPHATEAIGTLAERGIIKALVLKPMLLGGISRTLELARIARRLGLGTIVSHLFDGPIAFNAYHHLARAIGEPRFAQGLAPHAGLSAWPGEAS